MQDSPLSCCRHRHLKYNGRCRRRQRRRRWPSQLSPRRSGRGKWDVLPREKGRLMECSGVGGEVEAAGCRGCLAGGRSHLRLCILDWDGALHPGEGRSQATSFSRREQSRLKRHRLAASRTPNTLTPSPHTPHSRG